MCCRNGVIFVDVVVGSELPCEPEVDCCLDSSDVVKGRALETACSWGEGVPICDKGLGSRVLNKSETRVESAGRVEGGVAEEALVRSVSAGSVGSCEAMRKAEHQLY